MSEPKRKGIVQAVTSQGQVKAFISFFAMIFVFRLIGAFLIVSFHGGSASKSAALKAKERGYLNMSLGVEMPNI